MSIHESGGGVTNASNEQEPVTQDSMDAQDISLSALDQNPLDPWQDETLFSDEDNKSCSLPNTGCQEW